LGGAPDGDEPAYLPGDLFAIALLVVLTADVGEPIDHRGHLPAEPPAGDATASSVP
jgi:hypothetical protein